MKIRIIGLFVLLACLSFFDKSLLSAQTSRVNIVINNVQLQGDTRQQALHFYVTLVDNQKQVLTEVQPTGGSVGIVGGGAFPITRVERPQNPLYVVLILDSSGSMSPAAQQMREAAVKAVQNSPAEAYIAIIEFNEEIHVRQNFTADRTAAINAITATRPQNKGTCLYDATMRAMDELDANAPELARRAIILFTDGRDELIIGGELDPCSQSKLEQVQARATQFGRATPIYTIGLTGMGDIDESALFNLSEATGGLSRAGATTELETLFASIMQGLRSQWLAVAEVCLTQPGQQDVALTLTANSGGATNPALTRIQVNTPCELPPTPLPPSPTPQTEVFVETFQFNPSAETASFEIRRTGGGEIGSYRVQIKNADTNLQEDEFTIPADGSNPQVVERSTSNLSSELVIVVSALNPSGELIARSADAEFVLQRPTATPAPTTTPEPILVTPDAGIQGIEYDRNNDTLLVLLTITGQQDIEEFVISFVDPVSASVDARFTPALTQQIVLTLADSALVPMKEYVLRTQIRTKSGGLSQSEVEFTYTPILPPTPTPIPPTPTPTATPKVMVMLEPPSYNAEKDMLVFSLVLQQAQEVVDFQIQMIDFATKTLQVTYTVPVSEIIELSPSSLVPSRAYTARSIAITRTGERIVSEIEFTDPRMPSPTPITPTVTPVMPTETPITPSPMPQPALNIRGMSLTGDYSTLMIDYDAQNLPPDTGLVVRLNMGNLEQKRWNITSLPPNNMLELELSGLAIGTYSLELTAVNAGGNTLVVAEPEEFSFTPPADITPQAAATCPSDLAVCVRDNPLVLIILAVALILLVLLFMLLVRSIRPGGGSGDKSSNPYATPDLSLVGSSHQESRTPASSSNRPMGDDQTIVGDEDDPTITEPSATLEVRKTGDATKQGQIVAVDTRHGSFTVGRRDTNTLILNDRRVSREHAEITYDGKRYYIQNISDNLSIRINGREIGKSRQPLNNRDVIQLGIETELVFIETDATRT